MVNGSGETHQLLDGRAHVAEVLEQRGELIRVVEEGDDAVADQARGRVVTGDDQLEQAGEQFLVVQLVAVVC